MGSLLSYEEVCKLITLGQRLILAGDKKLLDKLPMGNWIAGTIPYFMSESGGVKTSDKIFVTKLPEEIIDFKIVNYAESELSTIPLDYYSNGFSYIIIPSFSKTHTSFAENCSSFKKLFDSPLIGWIAGFDLDDKNAKTGIVYNGLIGKSYDNKVIVIHLSLDKNKKAKMNLINLFTQGNGDIISFTQKGFQVSECLINGKPQNFANYLIENEIDTKLPLVTDYLGFKVNASFKSINQDTGIVELFGPVFVDVEYQIASPVGIYEDEFNDEVQKNNIRPFLSCNCILNYLYANLEGKKTDNVQGPMTFGEIAHILLNQTMVYLSIEEE